MYHITLSAESAESMFRDILIQDYKGLVKEVTDLENRLQELKPYEFEDLVANRRWRNALAVMMEYYLTTEERNALLNDPSAQT